MDSKEIDSYKAHFKYFEKWRKAQVDGYLGLCLDYYESSYKFRFNGDLVSKNRFEIVKGLPNTLVRLTRHMCQCNEDCTVKSLSKMKLGSCPLFKAENFKEDDKYYDFPLIDKKVVDGVLIDRDILVNGYYLRETIKELILDLCNDKKDSLRKLKCKAYELIDYCIDYDCIVKTTYDVLPSNFRTCKNPNFSSDLDNIGNKIGDPLILKHVRVSRSINPSTEIDNIFKNSSNANSVGLLKFLPIALVGVYLARGSERKISFRGGIGLCVFLFFMVVFYTLN